MCATRDRANVLVVGAGVTGLTTALLLSRKNTINVEVIAKHLPGDSNPEYTSAWAAANVVPVSEKGSTGERWDRQSWVEFLRLASENPEAGVQLREKTSYVRGRPKPSQPTDWFSDLVQDYRILGKEEVPAFADWGIAYRTFCINPDIYLHFLLSQCIQNGVSFTRKSLKHINEAISFTFENGCQPNVVVNCTGLWSKTLGGVEDEKVLPVRGQLVIVANESRGMYGFNGWDSASESCYIIPRPFAGGTALGGSHHVGSFDTKPDLNLSRRIMERAVEVCPHLVEPGQGIEGLKVIAHTVGLRPFRIGGPRVQQQTLPGGLKIVHNYGAGGFGYQSSYGMAEDAVRLVEKSLKISASL